VLGGGKVGIMIAPQKRKKYFTYFDDFKEGQALIWVPHLFLRKILLNLPKNTILNPFMWTKR